MGRGRLPWAGAGLLFLAGCAGVGAQAKPAVPDPRLEELGKANARLELRVEEVTRTLLALRERVDAQEAALDDLRSAARPSAEAAPAPLRVVKLEPPAPSAAPEAERVGSPAADVYRKAFNSYREGRYGQAILDFEEFLRGNPDHEYADNAQYWIGESYYSQGEYEQAVVEFQRVLERYPQQDKAPDALLKIGMAYQKMGDAERGRVFLGRLAAEYPQSEAAHQAKKLLSAQQP